MKKYIIFTSNMGIEFERTDSGKKSSVRVKELGGGRPHMIYRFPNRPDVTFSSPFISWENLNCVYGWTYDETYLYTAVQEEKKLCAGISFGRLPNTMLTKKDLDTLIESLGSDCLYSIAEGSGHDGPAYSIDVVRKGKISDYIDLSAVKHFYGGVTNHPIDFEEVKRLCNKEMISLVKNDEGWKYAWTRTPSDKVVAGLLLGYPLESTLSYINYHQFPSCVWK